MTASKISPSGGSKGNKFILNQVSYSQRTARWDVKFPTHNNWAFLGLPADSMTCDTKGKRKTPGLKVRDCKCGWEATLHWVVGESE